MKTKMIFAVVAAMVCANVRAQQHVGTWNIQPRMGMNVSTISNAIDASYKVGIMGGVEADYQVNKWLGVSLGAEYSQQGYKTDALTWLVVNFKRNYDNSPIYEDIINRWHWLKTDGKKCHLEYINFPFMANVYIIKGLALKAGIQFGILTKADYPSEVFGEENSKINIRSFLNAVDISVPLGISYEYANFVLDARYHFGLPKVKTDDFMKDASTEDRHIYYIVTNVNEKSCLRNSYLSVTLGYKFHL